MATNRTFTMIKPDAVQDNHIGAITQMMEEGGFRIVSMKKTRLTPERAGEFYAVHKERPFYNDLVSYMSKGPIVAMILEKDNAVEDFRKLIGATNPAQAEEGLRLVEGNGPRRGGGGEIGPGARGADALLEGGGCRSPLEFGTVG